jgi:predicted ATPase
MKITHLELRNFRCFEKTNIDFSPITILAGANSSGKSSIIGSILGALQANSFPYYYSPNGEFIEMGDFQEIVHNHNNEKEIGIDIGYIDIYGNRNEISSDWINNTKTKMPMLKSMKFSSFFGDIDIVKKTEYILTAKISDNSILQVTNEKKDEKFQKVIKELMNLTKMGMFDDLDNIVINGNILEHKSSSIENINKTINLANYKDEKFESLIRGIGAFDNLTSFTNYIGSFRYQPERTYYQKSGLIKKIDRFGGGFIDQIVSWEANEDKRYFALVKELEKIEMLRLIKTKRLSGGRYEIRVKTYGSTIESNITDVGFGISQFLPIAVADKQLPSESILFLSQPEIHLHPSIQAQMGNYFADGVKNSKKQYIIETHSEYLINRLRLLVAEKKIKKDDVSLYYFSKNGSTSKTYKIDLGINGEISNAPNDFFDTYQMDTLNIAMAGVKR